MKNTAWATFHTLPTGQAIRIFNVLPQPGMQANIYANRAIKRTNPALDATFRLRDDMPGRQCSNVIGFVTQWNIHMVFEFLHTIIYPPCNNIHGRLFEFIDCNVLRNLQDSKIKTSKILRFHCLFKISKGTLHSDK